MSCFAASWLKLMPTCSSNLTRAQRASWHQSAQFPSEMCKPSTKPLLNPLFASDYRAGVSNSAWITVPMSPPSCLLFSWLCSVTPAKHTVTSPEVVWDRALMHLQTAQPLGKFASIYPRVSGKAADKRIVI